MKANLKQLNDYSERDQFPRSIFEGLRDLGFRGFHIQGYGSAGLSLLDSLIIMFEIAKFDTGFSVFLLSEIVLGMSSLNLLGSEE